MITYTYTLWNCFIQQTTWGEGKQSSLALRLHCNMKRNHTTWEIPQTKEGDDYESETCQPLTTQYTNITATRFLRLEMRCQQKLLMSLIRIIESSQRDSSIGNDILQWKWFTANWTESLVNIIFSISLGREVSPRCTNVNALWMGRGRFSYRLLPDFHGLGREGLLSLVSQDAEDLESREREDGVLHRPGKGGAGNRPHEASPPSQSCCACRRHRRPWEGPVLLTVSPLG